MPRPRNLIKLELYEYSPKKHVRQFQKDTRLSEMSAQITTTLILKSYKTVISQNITYKPCFRAAV
jgi:hypothetical protein